MELFSFIRPSGNRAHPAMDFNVGVVVDLLPFPSVESETLPPELNDDILYRKNGFFETPSFGAIALKSGARMLAHIFGQKNTRFGGSKGVKESLFWPTGPLEVDGAQIYLHRDGDGGAGPLTQAGIFITVSVHVSGNGPKDMETLKRLGEQVVDFFEQRRTKIEGLEALYVPRYKAAKVRRWTRCWDIGRLSQIQRPDSDVDSSGGPGNSHRASAGSNAAAFADIAQWFASGSAQRSQAESARDALAQGSRTERGSSPHD